MNEFADVTLLPRYAVVDRRADGRLRILRECGTERDAVHHVQMLRWAGSPAFIVAVTRVDGADGTVESMVP